MSWSASNKVLAALLLPVVGWSYDQTFSATDQLPGTFASLSVTCTEKTTVGGSGKGVSTKSSRVALPAPYLGSSLNFTTRMRQGASYDFLTGGAPSLFGTTYGKSPYLTGCTVTASASVTKTASITIQASHGSANTSYAMRMLDNSTAVSQHKACGSWPASVRSACPQEISGAIAAYQALVKAGLASGTVDASTAKYWVYLTPGLKGGGGNVPDFSQASVTFAVNPTVYKTSYLPVSWFRDPERLGDAKADVNPYNLQVMETFVASAEQQVPVYLGDKMFIPDPDSGLVFPETNGQKVRWYYARGVELWKVSDLEHMPMSQLKTLNLPWMDAALNQDDYEKPAWSGKQWSLDAMPQGRNWPPKPPDYAKSINPPSLANCPDMFQYYSLYKRCADDMMSPDVPVHIGDFINVLDQINSELGNIDGQRDYTVYKPNGSLDPAGRVMPGADKHYDINSLARLNPTQTQLQDPFQANNFWMIFEVKHYCWLGLCSVDKDNEAWWYDGYFKLDPSWRFQSWIQRHLDVTPQAKAYLADMTTLFNDLQNQRDLFAFAPLNWQAPTGGGMAVGGGTGSVTYGNLTITSSLDAATYATYLSNADKTDYTWRVYLGNPNANGGAFTTPRDFVMDGELPPMSMEHEWFWTDIADKMYRHYVVQTYPIVFQDANGGMFPIGEVHVKSFIWQDGGGSSDWQTIKDANGSVIPFGLQGGSWSDDQAHYNWIGNNFSGDNATLNNDAPAPTDANTDTYDAKSAEYLTDKYDLNHRDPMTWQQKKSAGIEIAEKIAISEGLDLLIKVLYNYRKAAWYVAQKIGLEIAIRTAAKYAVAIYRVYEAYRSTMDQMREVRDASRRLKRNFRLLRTTYKDVWKYYVHDLDYASLRPTNITKLVPQRLLGQSDLAMWSTVSSLSSIAKGSHLLTLKFEAMSTQAFGAAPHMRFHRNEQQEVAQIMDQNSSQQAEAAAGQVAATKASNPDLQNPDQVWKLSSITGAAAAHINGSGIWLENGYTRGIHNALSLAEADSRSWVALKDRLQWQYANMATVFMNKQSGGVQTNLANVFQRSAYVSATPVQFVDPVFYPVESQIRTGASSALTCGGKPCYGN